MKKACYPHGQHAPNMYESKKKIYQFFLIKYSMAE